MFVLLSSKKNKIMEDIDPKTVRFFEGLVKHAPVRETLLQQLNLLDSLTLIRLSNASSILAKYIKDDRIWQPRVSKLLILNSAYFFDSPEGYVTASLFAIVPSSYDAFLVKTAETPHIWFDKKAKTSEEYDLTKYVINVQDWNVRLTKNKGGTSIDFLNKLIVSRLYERVVLKRCVKHWREQWGQSL